MADVTSAMCSDVSSQPKRRKLLIVVENMPVPLDTRVWKEAISLRAAGYEVTVLCPRGRGLGQFKNDCSLGYEVIEGVHIYRHPMPGEGNGFLGYLFEYGCALFWEFLYTWRIYLSRGFDVLQGCNPPDTIFLVALPFKLFGVKYIFDHHDANPELYLSKYERYDLFYKIQLFLEKMTFRCSDVVMTTNNSYRELAITRGRRSEDSVFVVRNGPYREMFKPVAANPALKHGKRFLIGYVGNMSVQEGLDILLDAALELKRVGRSDIHFTCVGGGPGFPELQRLNREKDLEEMVTFTGRISDADLLEILSTADVCVNPDKPCAMNGMSTMIKIMEYMALGKPIVQFDGREGRFSAQEASLYCSGSENAASEFAEKIVYLLDHPEERARMGEFGRRRVDQELAWEYSVQNLLAAYDTALNNIQRNVRLQAGNERP